MDSTRILYLTIPILLSRLLVRAGFTELTNVIFTIILTKIILCTRSSFIIDKLIYTQAFTSALAYSLSCKICSRQLNITKIVTFLLIATYIESTLESIILRITLVLYMILLLSSAVLDRKYSKYTLLDETKYAIFVSTLIGIITLLYLIKVIHTQDALYLSILAFSLGMFPFSYLQYIV